MTSPDGAWCRPFSAGSWPCRGGIRGSASTSWSARYELVGALWLRIRSYPLERRPLAIVSNLVLDARKDALAELRPLPLTPPPTPRRHAVAANLLVQAVKIGVIDAPIAEVMSSVYVLGLSGEAAARRHGVTATTVRWRCSAGMRRLAQARDQLV